MKTPISDYDYHLPEELIAHTPAKRRDWSRLMVVDRETGTISERHFKDVVEYLRPNDLLVVNNTKVIPATLAGKKVGGTARIEVLLIREVNQAAANVTWEALVKPGKRLKPGGQIIFKHGKDAKDAVLATVKEKKPGGVQVLDFSPKEAFSKLIKQKGKITLPPYINVGAKKGGKALSLLEHRYQTVYAQKEGATAAPTAGLHFTKPLLTKIKKMGVKIAEVTLHTGLGTFQPVYADFIEDHRLHQEWFEVSEKTAALINETKDKGGRVIAVGTTSVRTLETTGGQAGSGETALFITPGYKFKVVDVLITNFHTPKSTLLMLVSAFTQAKSHQEDAGRKLIFKAYELAKQKRFRFFSFGDAMLII